MNTGFLDIDYAQSYKAKQKINGDVFLQSRDPDDHSIVCTLSDGLGSGVKANMLATLTATMAQKYVMNKINVKRSASIIMNTLPVCRERGISYATFTILSVRENGTGSIIEYDNPEYIFFRGSRSIPTKKRTIDLPERLVHENETLLYSDLNLQIEDRILVFSDGVKQSGIGTASKPFGWRREHIVSFIEEILREEPEISSRKLSKLIVREAVKNDVYQAGDDITCMVLYFRRPRTTLLVSGPPSDPQKDSYITEQLRSFKGRKIIAGGTTAEIASRGLGKKIKSASRQTGGDVPPPFEIEGIDLVTEGMITLSRLAAALENKEDPAGITEPAVSRMFEILLESDRVSFLVGTKINEAHQNPDMPVSLGIRRTLVERIIRVLEQLYLKETDLVFV